MGIEIKLQCCGGKEGYPGQCLKRRCPLYAGAEEKVQARWPRITTGFGNAYGEPKHQNYLDQVAIDVKNETQEHIKELRESGTKFGKWDPSKGNPI